MLGMTTHSENNWKLRGWEGLSDVLGEAYHGDGIKSTNLYCILADIKSAMEKVKGKSALLEYLYKKVRDIIKHATDARLFGERA